MQFEIFLTPDQIKAIRAGDNRILVDEDQSEGLIESYFEGKEAECSASFPFEMFDVSVFLTPLVSYCLSTFRKTNPPNKSFLKLILHPSIYLIL